MALTSTTHINFCGTAREALDFYAYVFGGHVVINTYADFGMPADAPGADGVVFGLLVSPTGVQLMAYDIPGERVTETLEPTTTREHGQTFTKEPFFVAIGSDSLEELTQYWDKVTEGGHVVEPLAPSAWSPGFGMVTDRFGVTWSFSVNAPQGD